MEFSGKVLVFGAAGYMIGAAIATGTGEVAGIVPINFFGFDKAKGTSEASGPKVKEIQLNLAGRTATFYQKVTGKTLDLPPGMKAWNDGAAVKFTEGLKGLNKSVAASMLALQLNFAKMNVYFAAPKTPSAYHAPASTAPKAGEGFSSNKPASSGKSGPPRLEFTTDKGTFTLGAVTPKSGIIPPKPVLLIEYKPNSPGKETGKSDWMSIKAKTKDLDVTPSTEAGSSKHKSDRWKPIKNAEVSGSMIVG